MRQVLWHAGRVKTRTKKLSYPLLVRESSSKNGAARGGDFKGR